MKGRSGVASESVQKPGTRHAVSYSEFRSLQVLCCVIFILFCFVVLILLWQVKLDINCVRL